jgi:signal transduction histidine kinase
MRLLLRVLVIGFSVVILLLLAGAAIDLNNARSISITAAGLVSDQLTITRLLDEVEREQGVLNAAFYRISRTPENVDRERVLSELDRNDRVIEQLVASASAGKDREAWQSLRQAMEGFSTEARGLLAIKKLPEAGSRDLFFRHEDVTAEVARLVDLSYARAVDTQKGLEEQSARLARESTLLVGSSFLVALACAAFTVRLAARVFRQMEEQSTELSRVSFRLLEVQEATARRFAHELHDELGGSLTAIKTNLSFLAANPLLTQPEDRARVEDCAKLVEESISNVRELSQLLRPTILDDFGLDAGLRWLVARFQERTRVPVHYQSKFDGRLPDETETHLFRIVQEALTNVARHAGATQVTIDVEQIEGTIRLRLADNGRGLGADRRNGMGLSGMRARARSAGGELTLKSEPGGGVTIEVWAPVEKSA